MESFKITMDSKGFNQLLEQNLHLQHKANFCVNKLKTLDEKVDFYMNLSTDSDYKKGFYDAFVIMKNLLKGGV